MQLAVDVQIPDEFGGLNGEAIYIGTCIYKYYSVNQVFYWLTKVLFPRACLTTCIMCQSVLYLVLAFITPIDL